MKLDSNRSVLSKLSERSVVRQLPSAPLNTDVAVRGFRPCHSTKTVIFCMFVAYHHCCRWCSMAALVLLDRTYPPHHSTPSIMTYCWRVDLRSDLWALRSARSVGRMQSPILQASESIFVAAPTVQTIRMADVHGRTGWSFWAITVRTG